MAWFSAHWANKIACTVWTLSLSFLEWLTFIQLSGPSLWAKSAALRGKKLVQQNCSNFHELLESWRWPSIGLNGCAAEREKRLGIAQNRVFTRTKWLPDVANIVCAIRAFAFKRRLYGKVEFMGVNRIVMASILFMAAVVDAVIVWFANQGWQIAVELLCTGDVWTLGITRNPVFSRTKWLQPDGRALFL